MRADWRTARIRESAILADFAAGRKDGITAADLGRKYGVSACRAWQIIKKKYGPMRKIAR